jgi:SAM-dependent methyltransferase
VSRPLYSTFAWAYDAVVPKPGGPGADEAARLLAGRRAIVDAGCGSGRHAAALAAAGFAVTGIDTSPELIEVARSRGSEARFEVADLRSWLPGEPADGVLCRSVLNDFTDDADRQAALDNLARMLRPGGLVVLDVRELQRSRDRYAREPIVRRSGEGVHFRSETRFEGDVMLIREAISSADARAESEFRMRPWTKAELEQRLAAAGFGRVELRTAGDRMVVASTLK